MDEFYNEMAQRRNELQHSPEWASELRDSEEDREQRRLARMAREAREQQRRRAGDA